MLTTSRSWLRAFVVTVAATAVAAVTGALPAHAAPVAETSYTFRSAAGDYIGGGASASYKAPPAEITVSGTAQFLTVRVTQDSDWWYIDLAAPRGEQLRPGRYLDAERASFRTGRAPGLDVFGNGRGCNQIYGQFTIDQIETDASGAVTTLDARFTQRCESASAPALTGTVRYRAFPLSYRFVSEPGDYIGGGVTRSYTNSTTVFSLSGDAAHLTFQVSGQRDNWWIDLAAPAGQTLSVGTYTGAARYPFQDPDQPGLSVSGNGRGCNTLTGQFTIREIQFDAAGAVTALFATFEQHCEGMTPALRGTIHYYA